MRRESLGLAACILFLAACGGADDGARPASAPRYLGAGPAAVASAAPATDDDDGVQRLYLAYLGRVADLGGQAFFSAAMRQAGLPADPGALAARYGSDPVARQLLDSLAGSAEGMLLLPDDRGELVTAVYHNLFNRDPDAAGKAWWTVALASGVLTRAQFPAAVLAGADAVDLKVFERKLALARAFAATLAEPGAAAAYQGKAADAALRTVLAQVTAATDAGQLTVLLAQAQSALQQVPVFTQVEAIVRARCVACHSEHPTMPGFFTAPRNTRFDTPEQIRADATRIYVNVVQTEFMPYGNRTGMTSAERDIVRKWFESGAQ
jgi:hypothetical protein